MGGFGGGMGGPFGGGMGGPGFVFNVGGGPGVRVHQFGGGRPRRRPHNHENAGPTSPLETLRSLLPLLLLFILPLLSSLFSGDGTSGPSMRFDAAVPPHTYPRTSVNLKVDYFVNPAQIDGYSTRQWKDLDRTAENKYAGQLNAECEYEQNVRQRIANDAQGFFFTDMEQLKRARDMKMPNCERYNELFGRRRNGW